MVAYIIRIEEANKSESSGDLGLVSHDLRGGDLAEAHEGLLEDLVAEGVGDVLDVQVQALVLRHAFSVHDVAAGLELASTLSLLLGLADVQGEGSACNEEEGRLSQAASRDGKRME